MRTRWVVGVLVLLGIIIGAALATAAEAPKSPELELHGWMLTRYYNEVTVDDTRSTAGEISDVHRISTWEPAERISLYGTLRFQDGRVGYGEIYVHPWLVESDPSYVYLESLYLDVPAGPGAKVRIGKGRNMTFGIAPSYGNRKTSNYSPLSEAFTMDRVLGVQYLRTNGPDSFGLALLNTQRPGSRYIGQAADEQMENGFPTPPVGPGALARTTVTHLADRDTPSNRSSQLQVSSRFGHQFRDLNVGLSGRVGRMDQDDVEFLQDPTKAPAQQRFATYNGDLTISRYGADATFKKAPFVVMSQFYVGRTGNIHNDGWEIVVGVEPSQQCSGFWRELSRACKGLYVRYGKLNIDVPRTTNPITWDSRQLAVSYVLPLKVEGAEFAKWLQFEYESNLEDPPSGVDEIPNNLFFVELFSAF